MIYATQRPLFIVSAEQREHGRSRTSPPATGQRRITDGGKTVTVHIQPGVQFSPPVNREVTSADVAYAIERGANPNVANPYFPAYFGYDRRARQGDRRPDPGDLDAEQVRRSSST